MATTSLRFNGLTLLFIASVCFGLLQAKAETKYLDRFFPSIQEDQNSLHRLESRFVELGSPRIGSSCLELGAQYTMVREPRLELPRVQIELDRIHKIDSIVVVPALRSTEVVDGSAYVFPLRFRIDVSNEYGFQHSQRVFSCLDEDYEERGAMPLIVPTAGIQARYVRVTVTKMPMTAQMYTFALSEIMVMEGKRNVAIGASVSMPYSNTLEPLWRPANLTDGRSPLGPPIDDEMPTFDGFFSRAWKEGDENWMGIDLGESLPIQEVRLHPVHARQYSDFPGYAFPKRYILEAFSDTDAKNALFRFDSTTVPFGNPGNNPVTIPMKQAVARFIRVRCLEYPSSQEVFGLSEFEIYSNDSNVASGKKVLVSGNRRERPRSMLVDGYTSFGKIVSLPDWLQTWSERIRIDQQIQMTRRQLAAKTDRRQSVQWFVLLVGFSSVLLFVFGWQIHSFYRLKKTQVAFRTQMAQDFHDEIGSSLAGIARLCEVAKAEPNQAQVTQDLDDIRKMALETNRSMHETLWLVDARARTGLGVMASIRQFAERALAGCDVHWKDWDELLPESMPLAHQKHLYLLCKELVTNAARHSKATRVDFTLERVGRAIRIRIQDYGIGFDARSSQNGLGLQSVHNRAKQIGAALSIDSSEGQGTIACISLRV